MRKLSTVQNGGFPNIFSFHIIHYTLFSSLKNICNKKDFHVARQTCWWNDPSTWVAKTKVALVKFTKWFLFFFDSRPRIIFSLLSLCAILRSSERLKQASTYHENTPLSNWGRLKELADYSWSAVLKQGFGRYVMYGDRFFPNLSTFLGRSCCTD